MAGFLRFVRSFVLLLVRIGLGGALILHGWRRWQLQGIESQVEYLELFATPYAEYAAWGATILELVAGIFLIVGALTPLVAAAVMVEQGLIIAYTNWYKGASLIDGSGEYVGGWEYNVILGLLALVLVVFGAGGAAIDRLFRRSRDDEEDPAGDRTTRA
jgi:putative oxidoreductase